MATKPTRSQGRARDLFAGILVQIVDATWLAGSGPYSATDLADLASKLSRASVAYSADDLIAGALEQRARTLGVAAETAEMLTLLDLDRKPIELLVLDDDAFRAAIAAVEQELGEV